MAKNRIFLGGTCNSTTWREDLIKDLDVDYFNPVVEDWTPECQAIEMDEKENKCNIHLYVITKEMKGVFSIAEAVDSVHNKKVDTIFLALPQGFKDHELKSLKAVEDLIVLRGGTVIVDKDLSTLRTYLNTNYSSSGKLRDYDKI